jgi:hypothetical protein
MSFSLTSAASPLPPVGKPGQRAGAQADRAKPDSRVLLLLGEPPERRSVAQIIEMVGRSTDRRRGCMTGRRTAAGHCTGFRHGDGRRAQAHAGRLRASAAKPAPLEDRLGAGIERRSGRSRPGDLRAGAEGPRRRLPLLEHRPGGAEARRIPRGPAEGARSRRSRGPLGDGGHPGLGQREGRLRGGRRVRDEERGDLRPPRGRGPSPRRREAGLRSQPHGLSRPPQARVRTLLRCRSAPSGRPGACRCWTRHGRRQGCPAAARAAALMARAALSAKPAEPGR